MGLFLLSLIAVTVGVDETKAAHATDSRDLYQLILGATQDVYPGQLVEYEARNHFQIHNMAVAPQSGSNEDQKPAFSPNDHFLKLEVAAKQTESAARSEAVRSFPKDRKSAKALFDKENEKDGGNLPWVMEDQFRLLQAAFESGTRDAINAHWAAIAHFAADAAMPFNTTCDQNGNSSSAPNWCSPGSASSESICSLRERFQRSLFTRLVNRLTYEVRVAPDRARQIDDPVQSTFDVLFDSYDAVLRIAEMDRNIIAELRISDIDHFHASSDAYYSHLADRCGPILEDRIEAASLLTANLVRTAWIRAGRPDLSTRFPLLEEKTAQQPKATGPSVAQTPAKSDPNPSDRPAADKPYAGSVNSTIFHRVGCNHLLRVKPENVVYFATIEEAQAAGRTPCKTCKP